MKIKGREGSSYFQSVGEAEFWTACAYSPVPIKLIQEVLGLFPHTRRSGLKCHICIISEEKYSCVGRSFREEVPEP